MNYSRYLALLGDAKQTDMDLLIAENPLSIEDGEKAVKAGSILWLTAHGDVAGLAKELNVSNYGFGKMFGIPIRTAQQWITGSRKAPEYVVQMMGFILISDLCEG